jgi:hypothetical protein
MYRSFRRVGLLLVALLCALGLAQAVFAAPAADFSISDNTPLAGQLVTSTSTDAGIATIELDFDYNGSSRVR